MSTTYTPAPDVEAIATQLIDEYHADVIGAPITYVFRSPAAKSRGRKIMGKARKITGLNAYLANGPEGADAFLVIEIAQDIWETLTPSARHALIDHELSHCYWNPVDGPALIPHDVEEFAAVIARHGLWTTNLDTFVRAGQLRLIEEDA